MPAATKFFCSKLYLRMNINEFFPNYGMCIFVTKVNAMVLLEIVQAWTKGYKN